MLQHTFFFFLVSLLLLLFLFGSLLSLLLVTRLFSITETSQTAQSNKYSVFQFLSFSLSFFRMSSPPHFLLETVRFVSTTDWNRRFYSSLFFF